MSAGTVPLSVPTAADPVKAGHNPPRAEAVFAGGCFWCVEAVFRQLPACSDVPAAMPAATPDRQLRGRLDRPDRPRRIGPHRLRPAENLVRNAAEGPFCHPRSDQFNRQGNDVGTQYRSAIFYANDEQKQIAEAMIADLTDAKVFHHPIVTTLEPLVAFYPAEAHHQNYVACHAQSPTSAQWRCRKWPRCGRSSRTC